MRILAIAALLAATLALTAWILLDLRVAHREPEPAAPHPATAPPLPPPPRATLTPPSPSPPPRVPAPPPPPAPSPGDPRDRVVDGKTLREWRHYYAERQHEIMAEMDRYQSVVARAEAGEEPDPRELGDAHDKLRELKQRMKDDLEALAKIESSP
jgi:hypothetical protein